MLELLIAAAVLQAGAASPYAGEQERSVKALSAQETAGYLAGEGMGMARPAELNHYPGPKHVLDLGEALQLSDTQRTALASAFARMKAEAVRLGAEIVARETALDQLFARGAASSDQLRQLTLEIGRLQGELRAAHLVAHVETRAVLEPGQIAAYDRLRGYTPATGATPAQPRGAPESCPHHGAAPTSPGR